MPFPVADGNSPRLRKSTYGPAKPFGIKASSSGKSPQGITLVTVRSWVMQIGLYPAAYAAQSMRRTKTSLIYQRTENLRAVQLLLGHTKLESTARYLGIEVDDALEMAEKTEV